MVLFSSKSRPYHYGPYPLERIRRDATVLQDEGSRARIGRPRQPETPGDAGSPFAAALQKYQDIFHSLRADEPALAKAPVPEDLGRRATDIKGSAYFLNASQVGICRIADHCWLADAEPLPHDHAIVILVEVPRTPEEASLARSWVSGSVADIAGFRAYEVAISVANHIQKMGFSAVAHDCRAGDVDLDRLTVMAGLCVRSGDEVVNPYLDGQYAACAVSTDYALATDLPLAPRAAQRARNLAYWLGLGGATSGLERWRQNNRATHLSKFAMETVDRVDKPTTLIIDDEVPRVPKRASFFDRPIHGDLGEKSQAERMRFAFKHPLAAAMVKQIMAMVPHQDGPPADTEASSCADAEENTRAIKSLSYLLGGIPVGLLLVRWLRGVDVREIGSGNIGATNVRRAFGNGAAGLSMFLLVYVLDFTKGFVPSFWGPAWFAGPDSRAVWFGACAIVGHCASPFLRLRGGKGVATTTGVVAVLDPLALAVALAAFFVTLALTRRVFLGSLAIGGALAATIILREPSTAFTQRWAESVFGLAIAGFLVYTHRSNIAKMRQQ